MDSKPSGQPDMAPTIPISYGVQRRLLLGIGSAGLSQTVAAVQPILLLPLFLRAWGVDGYGHWLMLTALVSYLSLLDLGGQNYIGNLLAIDYARGDMEAFRKKLSEGVSLFLVVSTIAFMSLVALLFGISNVAVLGLELGLTMDERWIILLLATNFLVSVPSGVYVTAYRSTGLFTRGTMIGNGLRIGQLIAFASLLYARGTPVSYSALFLAVGLIGTSFIVLDSRRRVPACRHIRIGLAEARQGRQYLGGALQFWLMALATGLNQQGVLLVLSALGSPALVTLYATHRTAAGLVGYVGTLLQAPLWPELSFLWAKERRAELQRVALLAVRIVMLIAGVAALSLWLLLPEIYPLWTNKHLELNSILLACFLLQSTLAAGWSTAGWTLLAANQHRSPAVWSIANAVVTIVLAVWLAPVHGAQGVAVATLLGDLSCGFLVYPALAARTLSLGTASIYFTMLLTIPALLPLLAVVAVGNRLLQGWSLIAVFGLAVTVWSVPALRLVLGQETFNQLRKSRRLMA